MVTKSEMQERIDELERDIAEIRADSEGDTDLILTQGNLLTRIANAVHGKPAKRVSHSHHDLLEGVARMKAELDEVRERDARDAEEGM